MPETDPVKYFKTDVKRLNYYNSQFLKQEDFSDEQLYLRQMRYLHNRALHTWGIVEGLAVNRADGAGKVAVTPGIAIDRLGRELVLASAPDPVGLGEFDAGAQVYIVIKYADDFDDTDKDPKSTAKLYMRATERPKVVASLTAPPSADGGEVALAVVRLDADRAVASVDPSVRRYAGTRFGSPADGREFSIYADAAGAWHFADGARGVDRLTVDGAGNVGVGTMNPLSRLHVHGDYLNKGTGGITLDASDNITDQEMYSLRINPVATGHSMVGYQFQTKSVVGGTNVPLTLDHEGKVGIGVTKPDTRLHVAGVGDTELSLQSNDNERRWTLQATGGAEGNPLAGHFQIIDRTAAQSRLTITPDGFVGIGTTKPLTRLHVGASGTFNEAGGWTNVGSNSYFDGDWKRIDATKPGVNFHMNHSNSEGQEFRFYREDSPTNKRNIAIIGSEKSYVLSNVAVGAVDSGGVKLLVDTGGGTTVSLKCEHRGSNFVVRPLSAGGNATVIENTGGGPLLVNPSAGNVGVGTEKPESKLHLRVPAGSQPIGAMSIDVASFNTAANAAASYYLRMRDLGAGTALFVRGDGNVGLGTDKPDARLDVRGAIRAGGSDIYFTETKHAHTGIGNAMGFAAIENDGGQYDALMILGRMVETTIQKPEFHGGGIRLVPQNVTRRVVKMWDDVVVDGNLKVNGAKTGYVVDEFVNRHGEHLEQGDVVVICGEQSTLFYGLHNKIPVMEVDLTETPYDRRVCGVVSHFNPDAASPAEASDAYAKPKRGRKKAEPPPEPAEPPAEVSNEGGHLFESTVGMPGQSGYMVTHGAFAFCKVVGPVEPGDLLVASGVKRHAMRSEESVEAGVVVGKSLGRKEGDGPGVVPIFVTLQ